ncbi:TonB-dependent receptor [Cesiribacter sp. SM1]|uniref:SusC/RagA family TonB-linked outer membrane protein n=1 Tax=Cesiribacter sp. SM1 TaxID=2861196 RepID=UPI001CD78556|nr:TonB-dependent receptor [Cesiribacter sp. SM1]
MKKKLHYAKYVFWALPFIGLPSLAQAEAVPTKAGKSILPQQNSANQEITDAVVMVSASTYTSVKADAITVRGRVVGEDGAGLPGVTIRVKDSTQGTVTDMDGNYSISVPSEGSVLVFSFVGYVTQSIAVKNQTTINVSMQPDVEALEEVVVVGYGTQKKSDITGSISQVTEEQIKAIPVQNALQGIQGRAAGIDIASNARPGEVGSIRIRGNRSISGGNEPLYVVDGVPLQSGGIESFNPNDIASIEVLKDASAAAIYGSRGANGVVLISTKRGRPGKSEISYDGSVIIEKINDLAPNFNAAEYANYRRDAARAVTGANAYTTPFPNPTDDFRYFGTDPNAWETIAAGYTWVDKDNLIPQMRPTTPEEQALWGVEEVPVYDPSRLATTNWTDYVEQTGITHNHNISARMGTDKITAYISGGFLNQQGTEIGQDYSRYTGIVSIEAKPVDWITVGGTINAAYGIQNYGYSAGGSRGSRTLYEAAKGQLPFAVPYDAEGNYIYNPGAHPNIINPIRDGELVINERTNLRAFGSFFGEIKLMEGLRYRGVFGPDIRNYRNGQFQDERSSLRGGGAPSSINYARYQQNQNTSWTMENLLYYDKTLGENHNLGITLLQSSSMWKNESSDMTATDVPYNSQLWYNLGSTNRGALDGWGSGYVKNTLLSYMGRVNYSFRDKYLLTATGRWDGASVLADGHKWSFFPSLALGWKLDQEEFFQNISVLDEFKLRAGVGTTGNQAVPAYSTQGPLVRLPYIFGSTPASGYVTGNPKGASNEQGSLPNKALGWENTQQWNIGLDFGLFKRRIAGSIDYYVANTTDLLLNKKPLSVTGYSNITTNIGKTQNRGIELALNTINIDGSDFKWYTDITFSRNRSEIVELVNGEEDLPNNGWFIGQPLGVFYDYKKIGIWQQSDADVMAQFNANGATYVAGDIRVEDVNGDFKIDPNEDRQIIGTTVPKWTGGMANTFSYKNLELSAFVYARWGYLVQGGAVDMSGQFASRRIDYWTPNNPTNEYPRANYLNGGQPIHYSSMNYQDGSFVKVRYISLAYVLPQSLIERASMSNFKIYAQLLNPFLYSKTDFLDPDSSYQLGGANPSASSISTRSLVFGLNVSF